LKQKKKKKKKRKKKKKKKKKKKGCGLGRERLFTSNSLQICGIALLRFARVKDKRGLIELQKKSGAGSKKKFWRA